MNKIVLCTNHFSPSTGGAEVVVHKIATYLSADYEVVVLTRRLPGRDHKDFTDFTVVEYMPGDVNTFMQKMKSLAPQIVFIYSDVFDFTRQLITKNIFGKLVIALCGANWIHNNRNYAKLLYRHLGQIEQFICHSTYDRDYKFCNGVKDIFKKTLVIPNGVDIDEFDNNSLTREELSAQYDVDPAKRWVLNVSNFFPGKGQMHMLPIMKELGSEYKYIQVSCDTPFLVGQKLENAWKTSLRKEKIPVIFAKNIPRKNVVGFMKLSNVFSFTSEKEVAPLVILEAMAAKLPWVSADVGHVRGLRGGRPIQALKDRRYHSLFDDRVYKLFTQAIRDVTNSWGDNGYNQVRDELDWKKILPQYGSLFKKLCQN